ncbi:hypothetical protein Mgra_00000196, partial [Meloidogyne graminicola]
QRKKYLFFILCRSLLILLIFLRLFQFISRFLNLFYSIGMVARRLGLGANSGIHRRSVQHDQPVSQRELQQQLDWINELFVEVLSRLPDADKIKKKRSSCSRFLTTIGTVVGILGFFFGLYVFIDGKISSIETNIGNSIKQMEKNLNISLEAKFQVIEGRFKVLEGRFQVIEGRYVLIEIA